MKKQQQMTGLYTSRASRWSCLFPPHISLDAECHIQDPCPSAKCQYVYAYVLIFLVDKILALEE